MTGDHIDSPPRPPALSAGFDADPDTERTWSDRLRGLWNAIVGGIGLLVGLLPHVLHHVGLLVGTALIAGSGGTALFGALGFLASIPLLLRLRRRFGTWRSGHRAADLCRHVRAVNVRHWPCDEYGGRRKAGVGADGGPRRTSLLTPVQSRSALVLRSSDNAGATDAVAAQVGIDPRRVIAEVLPTDKISDVTSPTSSSRRARFRRGVTSLFTAFNICSAGIYFCGDL